MIQTGICGIGGRMGRMIAALMEQEDDLELSGALEAPGSDAIGTTVRFRGEPIRVSKEVDFPVDVMIDFSLPEGTKRVLERAAEGRFALVIGTTGLTEAHESLIDKAAGKVAVLAAPNMSVGMNFLFDLAKRAAARLGPEFDVEIIEMHHRHKKDAPSGSAKKLLESVQQGRGGEMEVGYGREGMTGARGRGAVYVHAVRGGDVVGDHQVIFAGPGERIELVHRATSRECFAHGALAAARFVAGAAPGRYGMADLLKR